MVNVNKQTQLNIFDTLKAIIIANSTLKTKFDSSNILEYEPSKDRFTTPLIVINIPELRVTDKTLGSIPEYSKDVDVIINLLVGYEARDKFRVYLNALVYALENESTSLDTSGYYVSDVEVSGSDVQLIFEKQVIQGQISLTMKVTV